MHFIAKIQVSNATLTSETMYLKTNATAKAGINYVRTLIESHNCIFQKIDQNDVGIDALVELVKNERPTGNFIGAQIKSGNSYFDKKSNLCKIPIGDHRDYWTKHSLPVYGIDYIPEYESAYWVDIKGYLLQNPADTVISYEPTLVNLINKTTFSTRFIPYLTGEVPEISYEFAKELFKSSNPDEIYLGLYTLFKKYADKNKVWDIFVNYFQTHTITDIPEPLVYYLSVIPWHPDMLFYKDSHTAESRNYGKTLLENFEKEDIIKLLHFIDEENMISRGSLGQSVEAIVATIPNFIKFLEEIIKDKNLDVKLREFSAIILASHKGEYSIRTLTSIMPEESWYVQELIKHTKEYGVFDPY
ncbi:MAG: DUF4365 domain-containing protein [Chitinophagales bacterium]|nr:DUF4365 domain-containing protein [Chitinophagales bacterium]